MANCRACNAEIEFRTTKTGKLCPYDLSTDTVHFATCPEADRFRKPRLPEDTCLKCGSLDVERLPGSGQHYAAIRCNDCFAHRWLAHPVSVGG